MRSLVGFLNQHKVEHNYEMEWSVVSGSFMNKTLAFGLCPFYSDPPKYNPEQPAAFRGHLRSKQSTLE